MCRFLFHLSTTAEQGLIQFPKDYLIYPFGCAIDLIPSQELYQNTSRTIVLSLHGQPASIEVVCSSIASKAAAYSSKIVQPVQWQYLVVQQYSQYSDSIQQRSNIASVVVVYSSIVLQLVQQQYIVAQYYSQYSGSIQQYSQYSGSIQWYSQYSGFIQQCSIIASIEVVYSNIVVQLVQWQHILVQQYSQYCGSIQQYSIIASKVVIYSSIATIVVVYSSAVVQIVTWQNIAAHLVQIVQW